MKVELMLTCICDAIYGDVGVATVRALEHVGCEVGFMSAQTCCGQPAFNAGDWSAARPIAKKTAELFELADPSAPPIVVPSASCAAMLRHGYELLGVHVERKRVYELCEFIVDVLGVSQWPGKLESKRIALHAACHHRMAGIADQQRTLLQSIEGVELVPYEDADQCCGFGGVFSLTHGSTSEGIGLEKLRRIAMSGAELVVSSDMGCVAHLEGLAQRNNMEIKFAHVAQILAEAART